MKKIYELTDLNRLETEDFKLKVCDYSSRVFVINKKTGRSNNISTKVYGFDRVIAMLNTIGFNLELYKKIQLTESDLIILKAFHIMGNRYVFLEPRFKNMVFCRDTGEYQTHENKLSFLIFGKTYNIKELLEGTKWKE